jgi:hypothetical protein
MKHDSLASLANQLMMSAPFTRPPPTFAPSTPLFVVSTRRAMPSSRSGIASPSRLFFSFPLLLSHPLFAGVWRV